MINEINNADTQLTLLYHIPHAGLKALEEITSPRMPLSLEELPPRLRYEGALEQIISPGSVRDCVTFRYDNRECQLRIACREKDKGNHLWTADLLVRPELTDDLFLVLPMAEDETPPSLNRVAQELCVLLSFALGKPLNYDGRRARMGRAIFPTVTHQANALAQHAIISPIACEEKYLEGIQIGQFIKAAAPEFQLAGLKGVNILTHFTIGWPGSNFSNRPHMDALVLEQLVDLLHTPVMKKESQAASFDEKLSSLLRSGGSSLNNKDMELIMDIHEREFTGETNHDQYLKDRGIERDEYEARVTRVCLMLLLAMLGYGEGFKTPLHTYRVETELPHWERLRLSSVMATKAE